MTTQPTSPAAGMGKRGRVVSSVSKEQRKRDRASIGRLRHQVISASTETRYFHLFTEFRQFHRLATNFVTSTAEELDELASEYVEMLWETGECKSKANYALAAIQHYRPQSKRHLPWAWKLVKVWNQVEIPIRATPLTPRLVMAMAGTALRWGEGTFGHLLVVGFSLFLRTGELLQLGPQDITLAVVFIPSLKGIKRKLLPLERLDLTEATALASLRYLCNHASKKQAAFWSHSRQEFMNLWNQVLDQLRLNNLGYKPYSLRRGGATTAYKNGVSLDRLLTLGRWQQTYTARIYLDAGLQSLAQLTLPPQAASHITTGFQAFLSLSHEGARGTAPSQRMTGAI